MQVPTLEEFNALSREVADLRRHIQFLIGNQLEWLDVKQATDALKCSRTTLHRLTKMGKLHPRYEGVKPLYEATEIRTYIQSTRVSGDAADDRVRAALAQKNRPFA
jgi:hypothetical protein